MSFKPSTVKSVLLTVLFFLFSNVLCSQSPSKYEVRAVWLTTIGGIDWPHCYAQSSQSIARQKAELCNILDKLQHAKINTILLQTRIRATTIYPSSFEPWDGCLSGIPGRSPGYDALKFAVEECHKRGMEIHAWVVTLPAGKWNQLGCRLLRKHYPGMLLKIGQEGYLNPAVSQTANYLSQICGEIVQNYDVDGIHLDYIRYPESMKIKGTEEEGRENITRIVKAIHDEVKQLKSWVKMSCSPLGKFSDLSRYASYGWNAYSTVRQNAQGWLKDGLMDELFPMLYFQGNQFYPFALDWSENNFGRIVVPGLGIYFLHPDEKDWNLDVITRQMNISRQKCNGFAFFRSKYLTDNTKGIYSFLSEQFDLYPALIPPMEWESRAVPASPTALKVNVIDSTTYVQWNKAFPMGGSSYLTYNIYASNDFPVNINDARNLLVTRYQSTNFCIKTTKPYYFAITSIDRYGNESLPLQMAKQFSNSLEAQKELLTVKYGMIHCLNKVQNVDAKYFLIESLQGNVLKVIPFTPNGNITLGTLPKGGYVLRTLNAKRVSHRIGVFYIK